MLRIKRLGEMFDIKNDIEIFVLFFFYMKWFFIYYSKSNWEMGLYFFN